MANLKIRFTLPLIAGALLCISSPSFAQNKPCNLALLAQLNTQSTVIRPFHFPWIETVVTQSGNSLRHAMDASLKAPLIVAAASEEALTARKTASFRGDNALL